MGTVRRTIRITSIHWHRWLSWIGGIALLLFAVSGMSHPIMTWTGPKAAAFFPPQMQVNAQQVQAVADILARYDIDRAVMVKIVPAKDGALLQVTDAPAAPRRYFDLTSGDVLPDHDKVQARWLAGYYTGLPEQDIRDVTFQTDFDAGYPWVNRLLPVYRVTYNSDDHRVAYIYTELGALGGLTNDWKTTMQGFFRALHTWNWLDDFEHARVALMMGLLLCLFGMAATGTALVFALKRRRIPTASRRYHRWIAYVIWFPLLAYSASGMYHLLHYAYGESHRGLALGAAFDISEQQFGNNAQWVTRYQGVALNGVSVIRAPDGGVLYRLAIPQGRPGQAVEPSVRFDGVPIEKPAIYIDAVTGEESALDDKAMVVFYARGFSPYEVVNTTLVTHFGPHYDFRNKRLPVWRIDVDAPTGDMLFIDPATGMLVDRLVNADRFEGYAFSFLHKWNLVALATSRMTRDIIVMSVLSTALLATIFGYMMLLRRRRMK